MITGEDGYYNWDASIKIPIYSILGFVSRDCEEISEAIDRATYAENLKSSEFGFFAGELIKSFGPDIVLLLIAGLTGGASSVVSGSQAVSSLNRITKAAKAIGKIRAVSGHATAVKKQLDKTANNKSGCQTTLGDTVTGIIANEAVGMGISRAGQYVKPNSISMELSTDAIKLINNVNKKRKSIT